MGSSNAGASGSDAGFANTTKVTNARAKPKKSILDYTLTGQIIKAGKNFLDKRNPGSRMNDPQGLYAEGLTKGSKPNNSNMSGGDSDNNKTATNVGGKIIIAPSTAEVSQSNATDVTYDARKTKAKGRSMIILTSSKGVRKDDQAVLGNKSLLGRA